jgi:ERCC4-type nuclease
MRIVVDCREKSLFDELKYIPPKTLRDYTENAASKTCGIYLDDEPLPALACINPTSLENVTTQEPGVTATCKHESHILEKKRLVIGDIALRSTTSDNQNDILLFERKTLNDLAASIRDGRYKEQSFRINQHCEISNHNVIYIIEGDMTKYSEDRLKHKTHNTISKKALYSAMFSMLYLKGFSIFRTTCIRETAELILYFADKYDAVPITERVPYYRNKTSPTTTETDESENNAQCHTSMANSSYNTVFKQKERSSQITPDNIGEIMISTIPFVSSKTASAIMSEYKTVSNLIETMKNDRKCLDHIQTTCPSGSRKISKLCVDNLFKFLIG